MITHKRLRQLVAYDPETGHFTRLVRLYRRGNVGERADKTGPTGYLAVMVDNKRYLAHRLAWFYMTGAWPKDAIDHKDTDKKNNRWSNLREATATQNRANTGPRKNNKSGFKGVHWHARRQKWCATITVNYQATHLGLFDEPELAHAAYCKAASQVFGEFARGV